MLSMLGCLSGPLAGEAAATFDLIALAEPHQSLSWEADVRPGEPGQVPLKWSLTFDDIRGPSQTIGEEVRFFVDVPRPGDTIFNIGKVEEFVGKQEIDNSDHSEGKFAPILNRGNQPVSSYQSVVDQPRAINAGKIDPSGGTPTEPVPPGPQAADPPPRGRCLCDEPGVYSPGGRFCTKCGMELASP